MLTYCLRFPSSSVASGYCEYAFGIAVQIVGLGVRGEPEFVKAVQRMYMSDHRIVGAEQHLSRTGTAAHEPHQFVGQTLRGVRGGVDVDIRMFPRDGHHLLRP